MRERCKALMRTAISHSTSAAMNGPPLIRSAMAFSLAHIDDRRRVKTPHGWFTLRTGNPIERWRADTLFEKEPETIRWLDSTIEAESVFYDVGANIGLYTLYACHMNPSVRAVCFEPEALNFARLNLNLADNGLSGRADTFAFALGATHSVGTLQLSRLTAGAAMHGDHNVALDVAAHRQGMVTMALDAVLELASDLPAPSHLKIDVDGPELAVVRGAERTLAQPNLRHLLVEIAEQEQAALDQIVESAGFHLVETGASNAGMANRIYLKEG